MSELSPPQSPRAGGGGGGGGKGDSGAASKRTFMGELYSMYYNGVASVSAKAGQACADDMEAWVMGKRHIAPSGTTAWVNSEVAKVSYFTYRNRFPQLLGGRLDHDAGWGCMIRTGQMMLSEVLKRIFLLKVMREQAAGAGQAVDEARTERFVRNMFMDLAEAPFGVHAMAQEGVKHSIPLGTWLTPTAICRVVRELVVRQQFISTELTVVLGLDGGISHRDISDALFLGGAVLALIPIMAGLKCVGQSYQTPILKCLEMPNTVGIVGGKPQRSLYFIGHQGENVFYLDPHVVQPAFVEDGAFGSVSGPRGTCPVSSLDPCMVLCFLFFSQEEFEQWERDFEPIHQMSDFPMFSLMKPKPKRPVAATSVAASSSSSGSGGGAAAAGAPGSTARSSGATPPTTLRPAPNAGGAIGARTETLSTASLLSGSSTQGNDDIDDCAFDSSSNDSHEESL